MKKNHCCEDMEECLDYYCPDHEDNPLACTDRVIVHLEKHDEYGLLYHDGFSYNVINFCPWCGTKLREPEND
ncbi:DUF6980 family protein [Paenibacillus lautus]|uniref:DUF6980 family protein n=1 Tax=Paenibacillus lautus TaxID=1401 RepID=UPI003D2C3E4C